MKVYIPVNLTFTIVLYEFYSEFWLKSKTKLHLLFQKAPKRSGEKKTNVLFGADGLNNLILVWFRLLLFQR